MLAIEIDGSSHDNEVAHASDAERQEIVEAFGIKFIRISDIDVKTDLNGVMEYLASEISILKNN